MLENDFELYELKLSSEVINLSNNKLKNIDLSAEEIYCMRTIKNNKLGNSATSKKNDFEYLKKSSYENSFSLFNNNFTFSPKIEYNEIDLFFPDDPRYSLQNIIDINKEFIEIVNNIFPNTYTFINTKKQLTNIKITNSCGVDSSYKKTNYFFSAGCIYYEEGNFIKIFEKRANSNGDINFKEVIEKIKTILSYSKKIIKIKTGSYPVIFSPNALVDILSVFNYSLNGKYVNNSLSLFKDKLNKHLFDSRFNLIDDGLLKGSIYSYPFDDEGTPTSRKYLIEKGIIKNFFLDRETSLLLNLKPTGNGFKVNKSKIIYSQIDPKRTNWIVDEGDIKLNKIINSVNNGLFVDKIIGLSKENYISGNISGNLSLGFLINNGEIAGRVKDTMISFNLYDSLINSLMAISQEREELAGNIYPYLAFSDIKIISKDS